MNRITCIALFAVPLFGLTVYQYTGSLKEKMKDFFFGLSLSSDMTILNEQLKNNTEFTFHADPNRDATRSVTGSISKDKNLNPLSTRNQVVISTTPLRNGSRETVSFAWFIDYKPEDLAVAISDSEKFKSEFKTFFGEFTTKQEIGYAQEEIESLYLEQGDLEVIIKMINSGNLGHTISIEFKDVRRKKK